MFGALESLSANLDISVARHRSGASVPDRFKNERTIAETLPCSVAVRARSPALPRSADMAIFRPPLEDLSHLLEPLNEGERRVAEALASLDDTWTVYLQPRIGQDVPDAVALHDHFGVCAIEVKNWKRAGYRQTDEGWIEYSTRNGWLRTDEQPRYQAHRYRSTIYDQFFALPNDNHLPGPAVRAIVILPQYSSKDAKSLLAKKAVSTNEFAVEVWGGDQLNGPMEAIVRGSGCPIPRRESMNRLRRHLAESQIVNEIRRPARLSPDARNIESNPNSARVRRVRGPAGCGKSFGLAARAARLAADHKRVLVLSFNVTLSNYLRTLVNARCVEYAANPTLITCVGFHAFCARLVEDGRSAGAVLPDTSGLDRWDAMVRQAAAVAASTDFRRYDAVLIDEGQDFTLEWWNLLRRHVVTADGEMLLVADPTQDVYDKRSWTDEDEMRGAGFSGPWTELKGSYRMPGDLVPLANTFASKYLHGERLSAEVPTDADHVVGHLGTTRRKWINIDRAFELGTEVGREVIRLLDSQPELSPRDIVFLVEQHSEGLAAVAEIESAGYDVHHIFSTNQDQRAIRKRRFWPDADGIKGCTVHSFKGWETPALVMGIGTSQGSRRLAYVAMTRLTGRRSCGVGHLSVVNSDLGIAGFQSSFEEWAPPRAEMRIV